MHRWKTEEGGRGTRTTMATGGGGSVQRRAAHTDVLQPAPSRGRTMMIHQDDMVHDECISFPCLRSPACPIPARTAPTQRGRGRINRAANYRWTRARTARAALVPSAQRMPRCVTCTPRTEAGTSMVQPAAGDTLHESACIATRPSVASWCGVRYTPRNQGKHQQQHSHHNCRPVARGAATLLPQLCYAVASATGSP